MADAGDLKSPSRKGVLVRVQPPAPDPLTHLATLGRPQYVLTGKTEGWAMGMVSTTRMSSKGQVVIPEDVRKALGLEVGAQFVVMGDGDTVVLKLIAAPAKSELRAMIGKVRSQARRAGMKSSDVGDAIRRVRRGR